MGAKKHDLIGKRFYKLLVIDKIIGADKCWICKCDCGNTTAIGSGPLLSGDKKSCGCLRYLQIRGKSQSRIGERWGQLVVTEIILPTPPKKPFASYVCKCDCGAVTTLRSHKWKHIKSCGCANLAEKHPKSKSTNIQVITIIKMFKTGYTISQLSRMYNKPFKTVDAMVKGYSWKSFKSKKLTSPSENKSKKKLK